MSLGDVARRFFGHRSIDDLSATIPLEQLRKHTKIVVIDDDEDSFPTESLKADGYTLEWWSRIDAARLQRLETGAFDIIVLDIQGVAEPALSDTGDGLGVLRRLKNLNPNQVVVAFSGKTYDLDSVPFWRLTDDALRKPVTIIQCKELLDRLTRERISVRGYWETVAAMLRARGVPTRRIAKLERRVVKTAEAGSSVSMDDIRDAVGTVGDIETIFTWVKRLITLFALAHVL